MQKTLTATRIGLLCTSVLGLPGAAWGADCVSGATWTATGQCTLPGGVTQISIQAWGGGGGDNTNGGGGGGGGSFCGVTVPVTSKASLTVSVGVGGGPVVAGAASEVTGGGITGVVANGGSAGSGVTGGQGGTIAACTAPKGVVWAGGTGGNANRNGGGGGGGGSAYSTAAGINGSDGNSNHGGAGGAGTGAGGSGGNVENNNTGSNGLSPGGGGGGAGWLTFGWDRVGADGQVILSWQASPPVATPAVPIPTLSISSLLALSGLLAFFGGWYQRRRQA